MRFNRALLSALAATTMFVATPTLAEAKSIEQKYTDLRVEVVKKFGADTAGRNIRKQGLRTPKGRVVEAQDRHYARSIRTFRRWLAPPAPTARPGDRISTAPAYAGGQFAIPRYIVMCESGGDYRKYNNAGSGASGAYQIMPGTWRAYGGSTANAADASPGEQDRIAAKIYAAEGSSPWSCR